MKVVIMHFEETEKQVAEEIVEGLVGSRSARFVWEDGDVEITKMCQYCHSKPVADGRRKYCSKRCMSRAAQDSYLRRIG